jgi:acetolactate decarboxylase
MSELEFLRALHVDMLRLNELGGRAPHTLFQTSTIQALLAGAFDGDVTLEELLGHGDLGLGTLNGLDGELIVIDGEVFKAELDCTLSRPDAQARTPYAVVVPFAPGRTEQLSRIAGASVAHHLWPDDPPRAPAAVRIDGRFDTVRVRSVPRQVHPYPSLATALEHQHTRDLHDVSGTMVGFCFPDGLSGLELAGAHLHFACDKRQHGGHVLDYTLDEAIVRLDSATSLHVELPPTVEPPDGRTVDQAALRHLETD